MGSIRFVRPEDQVFTKREGDAVTYQPEGADVRGHEFCYIFPGGTDELQLLEVHLPAHAEVRPHAHSLDEIIVVIEGELRFGARTCGPGSSVYIGADTLYGFRAGPEGVTYRNFRSQGGANYQSKDEFLAARKRQ
jgi:quercetin dioxygenase-like cupin family protein